MLDALTMQTADRIHESEHDGAFPPVNELDRPPAVHGHGERVSGQLKVAIGLSPASPLVILVAWVPISWLLNILDAPIPVPTDRIWDAMVGVLAVTYLTTAAWCSLPKQWSLLCVMLALALPVLWPTVVLAHPARSGLPRWRRQVPAVAGKDSAVVPSWLLFRRDRLIRATRIVGHRSLTARYVRA
jgi:hypothetical protein